MIDDLRRKLTALRVGGNPSDLSERRLACLRAFLDTTWEDIGSRHRSGASGAEVVQALTERADILIRLLYEDILDASKASSPKGYAILALGGYGRGTLNPKSDIDLLFLFREVREDDIITRTLLRTLWDLRLETGHSTRTIADCISIAQQDSESLTAMLEARLLVGDRELSCRLEAALSRRFLGRKARAFIAQKMEERRKRHAKAGLSVQLLEPNVKESPGGLRDTHTVGWFLKVRRGVSAPEGLLQERLLTRRSYQLYVDALDFLWRIRNDLHFSTGRRYDVLEHDLQPAIARRLGYEDCDNELGVEQFMRDYYLHARNIKHLSDLICERLQGRSSVYSRVAGAIVRRTLDDGAVLSYARIGLPKKRGNFFKDDPYRLLSIFLDAQRFGVRLNETAQRAVRDHIRLVDGDFRRSPRAARIFLDILRAPSGVAGTLQAMHELGVLGAYVPEFGSLNCLVQYNLYHIYTADEHTLVALENLERLGVGTDGREELVPLRKAFNELPRRSLLYLALLMHDVGKSVRSGDHCETGAEMARRFLERLRLPPQQVDAAVFLVRNHLTMSHLSQRRDLSDASMLAEFARQFDHPDVLRMLYLLTYADLSAVTRTAWTAWKSQLLRQLYVKTFDILTAGGLATGELEQRQEAIRNLTEALSGRFSPHLVEEHLANLPARYAEMNSPDEVAMHLSLIDGLGKSSVSVTFAQSGLFSEVTVCTRDKPYRLSEICGVLATDDINIFSAQAYTRTDGVVIDIFQVTDIDGLPEIDPLRQERVRRQLAEVFEERTRVQDLFDRHQQRWSRRRRPALRIPTEIHFENDISDRYTVIDVFAQDAVGLLYRITRTLSDLGLDIYTARISTQADKAVDSFYVTRKGKKIEAAEELERSLEALTARIG